MQHNKNIESTETGNVKKYLTDESIDGLITNQYASDVPARWIRVMADEIKTSRFLLKQFIKDQYEVNDDD